jgi:MoaA/NifB/PqqE/SkfB family radical SAM enzyme
MNIQNHIEEQCPEQGDARRKLEKASSAGRLGRLMLRLREMSSAISRFGIGRTLRIAYASLRENRHARRMRLEMFRLARAATFNRAIDVTELWNRFHPHLIPMPQEPGFLDAELLHCPGCGQKHAVRILAHVRLGARGWTSMRCILSCYACRRYSLPIHELLVPWVKQVLAFQSVQLTCIHAKLWTDASRVLNLEPTTLCNFNCWYCVGRHMKQEHLTYENFVRIIDGCPSLKHLALTGEGEPIMNKRFFDMVRYAKQKGLLVGITTNGSMFSQSNVKKLCDVQVDYLQISIDSSDPKRFAESRLGGDLRKVWEGIERLTTHRNKRGLTRPLVVVRGTLFSYSRNEIPEIVKEARKRGVDAIGEFQTLNPKESYVAIYPKDKLHHLEGTEGISQTIRKDRIRSELPFLAEIRLQDFGESGLELWPNGLRQSCDIAHMYSLLSGDMTPCCQIKSTTTSSWNLAEHGAQAVLRDEQYENMRFNLWNGFYLKNCGSCRGYTLAQMASGRPPLPVS